MLSLAKGLGSGVPIGACVAAGKAADVFTYGKHGSTFGGNPLATTAGYVTLQTIAEDGLCKHAEQMGDWIRDALVAGLKGTAGVVTVRNAGLMIGIELDRPCGDLVKHALEAKLLINVTADNVVRLLPPLVINQAEAKQLVDTLVPLIKNFLSQ